MIENNARYDDLSLTTILSHFSRKPSYQKASIMIYITSAYFFLSLTVCGAFVPSKIPVAPNSARRSLPNMMIFTQRDDTSSSELINDENDRRAFLNKIVTSTFTSSLVFSSFNAPANAGIDPSALRNYSVEGDTTGSLTRLKQIEEDKVRPTDLENIPYEELPSGVSYRQYREGKGDAGKSCFN